MTIVTKRPIRLISHENGLKSKNADRGVESNFKKKILKIKTAVIFFENSHNLSFVVCGQILKIFVLKYLNVKTR